MSKTVSKTHVSRLMSQGSGLKALKTRKPTTAFAIMGF